MRTKIQKWGNSLALRIPHTYVEEMGWQENSAVEITFSENQLIVKSVKKPEYTLEELLEGVTPENLHPETDTGNPVGNEVW